MNDEKEKALLVGDNPFHGISHLSQERSRARGDESTFPEYAASLVSASLKNGANGFMFSVSDTTLSILRVLREKEKSESFSVYAIVPYAHEYVRLANQVGGFPGLTKMLAREIVLSGNFRAIIKGLEAAIKVDPKSLMKAYLSYELSRIKSSAGKEVNLHSVLLHQAITDMALAFNLDWLFESYIDFMLKSGTIPGFNTGNFVYLVNKFNEWGLNLQKIIIATPFNKVGFQMCPSRVECEKMLANITEPVVIAISILASGYLKLPEAVDYIATLPNIKGVAVGVSKEKHAHETFSLLSEKFNRRTN
jgi:hypothetical protein